MSQLVGLESFRDFHSFCLQDESFNALKTPASLQLPKVDINAEKINPLTLPKHTAALAFMQSKNESLSKKILITWKTRGMREALNLLATSDFGPSANRIVKGLVSVFNSLAHIHRLILPHSQVSLNVDALSAFSTTRDWINSSIRCLAWHPHCMKLAVATQEDTVLVYTASMVPPVIVRHSTQKDISSLAWRPLSASHLAVGCALGVAVWVIDPLSLGTRPSTSCLNLLPHQTPVSCLAWHPEGKFLATGSALDSSLYIWNTESREPTILKKFRGGGYTYISWNPSGDHLITATPASIFRIWETHYWTANDWNVMEGHLQCAAWSPCGTKMIFADSSHPTLYCLTVEPTSSFDKQKGQLHKSSDRTATVIADFTEMQQQGDVRFGGLIQDLAWDPKGERLAVLFRFTNHIAVFRTQYYPTVSLFPSGIICGQEQEVPSTFQFFKSYQDGALLTVAWSSGRVQHIPFTLLPQASE